MKIFCLIPAFNETGNLAELTSKLANVLSRLKINSRILYIIQGDYQAVKLLKNLKKRYPHVDYLYYSKPLGIGNAYRTGFSKIPKSFTHVLTMDADLNHQPEELPKFIKLWKKEKPDVIIGSRFVNGGSFSDRRFWKRFVSLKLNQIIMKLLHIPIADKSSGYRLIKKEVLSTIKNQLQEKGYPSYIELILLAYRKGYQIQEVPINYLPRKWGESKMGKFRTAIDYLLFMLKLPYLKLIFKDPD